MRSDVDMLFRTHHDALLRFVHRQIGEGADDIVSATFVLAHTDLPARHPEPVGWLFRTARNLALAELRRSRRELMAARDAFTLTDTSSDALSDIEIARVLIGRPPDGHREVLQLTYWDRLTAAQAGVVLGCSERAVWKRISRAKAALRVAWVRAHAADDWESVIENA